MLNRISSYFVQLCMRKPKLLAPNAYPFEVKISNAYEILFQDETLFVQHVEDKLSLLALILQRDLLLFFLFFDGYFTFFLSCLHRYYHRSLNPKKLVDIKFSHIGRNQTMNRLIKLMRLPEVSCDIIFGLFIYV